MRIFAIAACLVLLFCGPARAAEVLPEWDTFTKHILCSGQLTRVDDHVIVISVPERAPARGKMNMRLYIGYVQDLNATGKAHALYKGPLASSWESPRLPLGEHRIRNGPLRYWVDRVEVGPGAAKTSATVEIDLRSEPPVVRSLAHKPGGTVQEAIIPLEPQPLSPSNLALVRGFMDQSIQTNMLELRPFSIHVEGNYDSSLSKSYPNPENHFFLVVSTIDKSRCTIHALHRAPFWVFERVLEHPRSGKASPAFLVEMIETYKPHDAKSASDMYHRRVHVRVGLDGVESRVIEDRLYYDAEEGEYRKAE